MNEWRGALVRLGLWACLAGTGAGCGDPCGVPEIDNGCDLDPRLSGMLQAHNDARKSVSPAANPPLLPLNWDPALAEEAQAYAERCIVAHDPDRGDVGENIFADSPAGSFSSANVVTEWISQRANYDYATDTCDGDCDHYKQIVWRESSEIGCGIANCLDLEGVGQGRSELWVCRYRVAGNVLGESPY